MDSSTFFKDISRAYYDSGIYRLNQLRSVYEPEKIRDICVYLVKNLNPGEIEDKPDLTSYTAKFINLQHRIGLLYETRPQNSCDWLIPLLEECYVVCGIDCKNRKIFTKPSILPKDYKIANNIFRDSTAPIVDIFIIPHLAAFDLGSIAVIGHEVGHILIDKHNNIIKDEIAKYLKLNRKLRDFLIGDKNNLNQKVKKFSAHLREHLCDIIGSRLLGPAFDLAFLRLFLTDSTLNSSSDTHPNLVYRMKLALSRMKENKSTSPTLTDALIYLNNMMDNLCQDCIKYTPNADEQDCQTLAKDIFKAFFYNIIQPIDLDKAWGKVIPELNGFRPPCETVNNDYPIPISPREIVICSSLYYYGNTYTNNDYYSHSSLDDFKKKDMLKKALSEHINYAIEISDFVRKSNEYFREKNNKDLGKSFLNNTLWQFRSKKDNCLIIVPTISPCDQYSRNAIDLRLGSSFLVNKLPLFTHVHPSNFYNSEDRQIIFEFGMYDPIYIPIGNEFVLHPHQFVLACTLEYICLPIDKYAFVLGRSTWGRLGLNIATATTVQPGFRGCLTLELRNLGETPLPLTVGTRIAQISVVSVPDGIENDGLGYFSSDNKYIGPVRVGLPKIQKDPDWQILSALKKK